jgi:predicted Fe-Mo cluster-binding NifX family protein
MKICVPTQDQNGLKAMIGEHFGRVPFYTYVDTESQKVKIMDNTGVHGATPGAPPAELIANEGADAVLCAGLGRRAIMIFEGYGIHVFIGAQGTVEDAIGAYQKGVLSEATDANACAQHAFRQKPQEECDES